MRHALATILIMGLFVANMVAGANAQGTQTSITGFSWYTFGMAKKAVLAKNPSLHRSVDPFSNTISPEDTYTSTIDVPGMPRAKLNVTFWHDKLADVNLAWTAEAFGSVAAWNDAAARLAIIPKNFSPAVLKENRQLVDGSGYFSLIFLLLRDANGNELGIAGEQDNRWLMVGYTWGPYKNKSEVHAPVTTLPAPFIQGHP